MQDGKPTGNIRFKVGTDNQGRFWIYAYTSQSEFSKALPNGGTFAEMKFRDVFKIDESDHRFNGINLNSASDVMYPIPRELFERVRQILGKDD